MSAEITLAKFGEMVAVKYSPQFLIPGSFKNFMGKFKLGCKGEIDVAPEFRFGLPPVSRKAEFQLAYATVGYWKIPFYVRTRGEWEKLFTKGALLETETYLGEATCTHCGSSADRAHYETRSHFLFGKKIVCKTSGKRVDLYDKDQLGFQAQKAIKEIIRENLGMSKKK